jgi:5-methyltetrahydropteroyltriglutamate--homocysteine methyltransferase
LIGRPVLPPIDARVYPDRDELFDDLGAAYRAAVNAFAALGCRYLQLDEVFIAMLCDAKYRDKMVARGDDPDELLQRYAALINTAIADIPADMTVTLHLCRGNFKSTYMGAGGYDAVEDVLFNQIGVHGYFMEYDDERSGGFEPLRLLPRDKRVALGLVTTKRGALESKDDLRRRIDEAAQFADLDQLSLTAQCGFASTEEGNELREDEQWRKLELIVGVARDVWG